VLYSQYAYYRCQTFSNSLKKDVIGLIKKDLKDHPEVDVDTHFNPTYKPWEQRFCLVPDNDFFEAIKSKKAEVVTATIESFTKNGILVKHKNKNQVVEELPADIVVMATGLKLQNFGGIKVIVDDKVVIYGDRILYKGQVTYLGPHLVY
jgi:monooxygenase